MDSTQTKNSEKILVYPNSHVSQIDKRSNLSHKELINEYVITGRPVVDTDGAKKWGAIGKYTPEFFRDNYGNVRKTVNGKEYTVREFITLMLNSNEYNPAPYPFNLNVEKNFPELLKDFTPHLLYGKSDRINHPLLPKAMLKGTEVYEIFLGGKGAVFPKLHIDALYLHTQITQLYGQKEFILYPPEYLPYLYPGKENPKLSRVNIFNPDFETFPLFRLAKPLKVMVNEGETIFFPTGWWHATKIHGPSISLGRIQLNHTNWNDFVNDNYKLWKIYNPKIAMLSKLYALALGKLMNLQEKFI